MRSRRQLELFTEASVAIDGAKFNAVKTRDENFAGAKMKRMEQIEESVERYLHQLASADRQEPTLGRRTQRDQLPACSELTALDWPAYDGDKIILSELMNSTNRNQEFKRFLNDNDRAQLSFSRRELHINEEPYYSGFIDRYLPKPIYRQLAQNFPAELTTINYDVHNQLESLDANRDSWANMPVLKELLTFFTTNQFLCDLREWIAPAMERHRQDSDQREWIYEHKWLSTKQSEKYRSINVTFKFVTMATGESLCPHTDESKKILSLVLYFADPDWKEGYGGGTDIYEPKYQILKNNWHDIFAPFELMNRLQTYQFVGNRLVFILKSANSWHGVSPIRGPGGMLRKTLLITFHDNNARIRPKFRGLIRRGVTRSLSLIEKQRVNLASANNYNHSVMVGCIRKEDTK